MSAYIIFIQCYNVLISQSNLIKREKHIKIIQDKITKSLYTDDIIVYEENMWNSLKTICKE
jgi:hypothetical protein